MRHTSATALVMGVMIGGVLGWAGQWLLVGSGNPALVPPPTWTVALVALGGSALALAWPIRAQVRAHRRKPPIDPFYATRVVLLAKAGAIAGAALAGIASGFLVFLGSRPVVSVDTLWPTIFALGGALVLAVSALVAERWCTLPPDSPEGATDSLPEGEMS